MSKNGTFVFNVLLDHLSVSHTPKMVPPYSLGTCPPKTLPEVIEAQLFLHQEKIDFLKTPNFAKSTQMAMESPKVDIRQN